jgi:hypothetical protein
MVLIKIESAEQLNQIYNELFNSVYVQKIDIDNFDTITIGLDDTRKSSLRSLIETNSSKELYVYLNSKTEFKKEYYSHMTTSLYEKYYNSLRNGGVIIAATGAYVLLQKLNNIDFALEEIQSEMYLPNMSKILNAFSNKIDTLEKDNKFYQDYINKLESKISDMQKEIELAQTNLYNKSISSWY